MMTHSNNLRVLHTNPYWLRFNENWIFNQIDNLPDVVTNHVFCQRTTNLDLFPAEHIYSLSKTAYGFHKFLRKAQLKSWQVALHRKRLLKVALENNMEIVHSHFGHFGWNDMLLSPAKKHKHVVTFYGADVTMLPQTHPVWRQRYKELFREVDRVLCEGSFMADRVKDLGCDPEKVTVHHLGVNVDAIEFRPRQWNKKDKLNILMASSFREKKGIPYAIKALGMLAKDVELQITIIGDASASPGSQKEKENISAAVEEAGLTDKVNFLGNRPYATLMKEAYKNHLFVSTSVTAADGDSEGGAPVSLIDMAATGMPIVSSFHCDIPEVILHGETGRLATERNINDIYDQLCWYVDHTEEWRSVANKARRRMETEYNANIQGERLYRIYNKL